jgi:hypothetical protein
MRMKTTTAFRAYTNIRARQTIERIAATARFMVKSVNKDGSISLELADAAPAEAAVNATAAYAGALVVMVGTQIAPSHSFTSRSCHVGSGARTGRQPFSAWRMAVQSATNASATS